MDFASLISFTSSSVTSVPAVSSRPFTAAFLLTLFGRLVYEAQSSVAGAVGLGFIPALAEVQGMNLPIWLISEVAIVLFGLLMLAEWYSDYDEDLRVMLEDGKTNLVKPGVAAVLQFGLVQGQSAEVLELMAAYLPANTLAWLLHLSPGVAVASLGTAELAQTGALGWLVSVVAAIWSALMAGVTWLAAGFRQAVVDLLSELDEDDSLGLMKIFSLAEGGWTATLVVVLIFLPLIALLLSGLTMLGLYLVRKWFERREERSKVACAACQAPMFPTALFCPTCRQPNESPRKVGLFGQAKAESVSDRTAHRLNLTARKRCHFCATRLPAKAIRQSCAACGTTTFADVAEANVYLRALDKKLPLTLIICGLLGLVPIVGLVPGIIYYRLSLIASLRAYIPKTVGCVTRWGLRFVTLFLIALQPFFLGWLTLPAMALLNYVVYRQVLRAGIGALPKSAAPQGAAAFGGLTPVAAGMPLPPPAPPSAPAAIGEQLTCAACGAQNPLGYRFCADCGSALATSPR